VAHPQKMGQVLGEQVVTSEGVSGGRHHGCRVYLGGEERDNRKEGCVNLGEIAPFI